MGKKIAVSSLAQLDDRRAVLTYTKHRDSLGKDTPGVLVEHTRVPLRFCAPQRARARETYFWGEFARIFTSDN